MNSITQKLIIGALALLSVSASAAFSAQYVTCTTQGLERWKAVSGAAEPSGTSTSGHKITSGTLGSGITYAGPSTNSLLTYLQPATIPYLTMYDVWYNSGSGVDTHGNQVILPVVVCECEGGGGWPRPDPGKLDRAQYLQALQDYSRAHEDHGFSPDRDLPLEEQIAAMNAHLEEFPHFEGELVVDRGSDHATVISYAPQFRSVDGYEQGDQRIDAK